MASPSAKATDFTSPARTVALLCKLAGLGFGDEHFRVVHHFPNATIGAHLSYCERTVSFREGDTNAKVQARLAIVLGAYQGGTFESPEACNDVFAALARAAVAEIPQ